MRHKDNYKYNYFYKITNNLNGNFYYGIHSTNSLDDGYMGSGLKLKRAYKKYGIENFSKEILKFFDTREELSDYEAEAVTEILVNDPNCYNTSLGGEQLSVKGTFSVYNKEEHIWERITSEDYDANPDKYIKQNIGKVLVYDINDTSKKMFFIDKDEYYNNRDKYRTSFDSYKDHIYVILKDNLSKTIIIHRDEFDKSKHILKHNGLLKNEIVVKDKSGNIFKTNNKDPRYLSGELVTAYTGYKWTDEQKKKLKEKFANTSHQKGENNSQFGTKWIYKDSECIKIKKEELEKYLNEGWQLGNVNRRKK